MQPTAGAQRASTSPRASRLLLLVLALVGALGAIGAAPRDVAAAPPKVVIVVGPVGSVTARFRTEARRLARQARGYGAQVVEIYSPWATWKKVVRKSRGADLFIYLGHGNGWPSPYGPFQPYTKNGLGLNPRAGAGDYSVSYKGEYYLRRNLRLARGAVVLLHRLCYASGNEEGKAPTPKRRIAKARADNYARGFLDAGASAVFAIGIEDPGYVVRGLFRTKRTMRQIFWSSPGATPADRVVFDPRSSDGRAILDPHRQRYYFRSLVGKVGMRASAWR